MTSGRAHPVRIADVTEPAAGPTSGRRDVAILGSTGSIGTQALEVVRRNPDRFRVVGLTAGGSQERLFEQQVAEFSPAYAGLGEDASVEAAGMACDVVLNGITGAVGLRPTVAALESGNTLALANKESLIIGGPVVTALARPGQIVPVDSEHSALAQCLRGGEPEEVRRLVLTASGGPFRGRSREELHGVTPEEALAHPTWDMGPVVTINSATLVNKGLEVIEAHLLFGIPFDRIEVVVHPTSVVHSMVEFVDGSTLVQASPPTMLIPIALGLAWPDRLPDTAPPVDWTTAQTWEFHPLDDAAFPAVRLAREAGQRGGTAPAVYNAANEVCVEAFRQGRLPFTGIVESIATVLAEHTLKGHGLRSQDVSSDPATSLDVEKVMAADAWARGQAQRLLGDS
jgi:1-deoxy-D-xylulose-5-phosphate reductoisomerase